MLESVLGGLIGRPPINDCDGAILIFPIYCGCLKRQELMKRHAVWVVSARFHPLDDSDDGAYPVSFASRLLILPSSPRSFPRGSSGIP